MEFVQNQYVQVVATLAALLSAPLVIIQVIKDLLSIMKGDVREKSQTHMKNITEISERSGAYMSACVLILIVRILAAFFCVTFSILIVITALFLHMANTSSPLLDVTSIGLLLISGALLLGTLMSAKKFSESVREKVEPGSFKGRTWI